MMKKYLILITFLICSVVYAVNVSDLYSVSVSVQSSSDQDRERAIQQSFKKVLIRVSGKTNAGLGKQLRVIALQAKNYVQDYDYSNDPSNALILNIRFVPSAINGLLKKFNQPVWRADRPLTLVWILFNNPQGEQLLSDSAINTLQQEIQQNADRRGIPVLFPVMDLADLQNVTASDLELPSIEVVQKASDRYHPDSILVANITEMAPKNLFTKWTLSVNNQIFQWQTSGSDENTMIASGIEDVADKLAGQFSVSAKMKTSTGLTITVQKLSSIDGYAKISHYLSGLTGVDNVQLLNVTADQAVFHLTLSTGISELQKQIELNQVLTPVSNTDLPSSANSGLEQMVVYETR